MFSCWESANPILFGAGTAKETGERLKRLGAHKVMVVYDMGVKNCGLVDPILGYIKNAGLDYDTYDKVEPNPPDYSCDECAEKAKASGCDALLAIGGGSAMDTAKGAALVLGLGGKVNDHFMVMGAAPVDQSKLPPVVVIPTTAGTGSESSPGGVITDTKDHTKKITSVDIKLGIVDPELCLGLPASITSVTGIDAYCHAAEAYLSAMPNDIAAVLSLEATRLIVKYLPLAVANGKNIKARTAMSKAATMATMSMRGPFGGIPHMMDKGIMKNWPAAHGVSVGVFMGPVLKVMASVYPKKVAVLAEQLGVETAGMTPEELGDAVFEAYNTFLDDVKFPRFKDVVKGASLEEVLAKDADFSLGAKSPFTPLELKKELVDKIITLAYER